MTDQLESETGNPAPDDVPSTDDARPGTSSQQAGPSHSHHPERTTAPDDVPSTSSQQAGPSHSHHPERTTDHPRKNPNWKVCRFNLSGFCRHGDKCWYSHAHRNSQTNTDSLVTRHSTTICPRHRIRLQEPLEDPPSGPSVDPQRWSQAPVFVPKKWKAKAEELMSANDGTVILCRDFVYTGKCPFWSSCPYFHGEACKLCGLAVLIPNDAAQNKEHELICMQEDMDTSFAIQWSINKECGICHEVVWEKEIGERKFGLLANCNHVFCLKCIRTWRKPRKASDDQEAHQMRIRTCPQCRVHSDFFVPSHYWMAAEEDKARVIKNFKEAVAKKPCKYFKPNSACLLGPECFYLHMEGIRPKPLDDSEELAVMVKMMEDLASDNTEDAHDLASDDAEDAYDLYSDDAEDVQDFVSDDTEDVQDFVRDDTEDAHDLVKDDREDAHDIIKDDREDAHDLVRDDIDDALDLEAPS